MALQIWMPLDGDLKNQGLDDIGPLTTTNASFVGEGKIGSCLKLGYTNSFTIPSLVNKKQMSIAYWCKVNTATSTNWLDPIHFYTSDGSTSTVTRQEFYNNCTNTGFWYATGAIYYENINVGEWYHYAITLDYNTGEICYYVNGEFFARRTNLNTSHYITGADFRLGENGLDVSENDVRIYDHILSPKEIKDISKGLVLHLPLNREGFGQDNLLKGNYSCESTTSTHVSQGSGSFPNIEQIFLANKGNKIWFSFDYSCEGERTAASGSLGDRYGSHLSFKYNKTDGTVSGQAYPCASFLTMSGTGRAVMSYTIPTDFASIVNFSVAFQPNARPSAGNDAVWYLRNFKLEIGDKATPWIPHVEDDVYSARGLDSNVVYDASGFQNNGVKIGTLEYLSGSPVYDVGTKFTSGSHIQIPINSNPFKDSFTICFWGTFKNNTMVSGSGNGNRLNLYAASGVFLHNTGDGANNPFMNNGENVSSTPYYDTIHFYAVTGNGTANYLYIDGELVGQSKTYKPLSTSDYYLNGWTNSTAYNANSLTSDFRIYATELSAEDILELYHSGLLQ